MSAPETRKTTLQQHVEFFDPDGDGIIWPSDTYSKLRLLAYPIILAIPLTIVIHLGFSLPSQPAPKFGPCTSLLYVILSIPALLWSLVPDPFFRIYIENIKRDIHGSDTRTYNVEGNFVNENFQSIFANNSSAPKKDSLSFWEALIMIWNHRSTYDVLGLGANVVEWFATWFLLAQADGRMQKDEVKAVYDGSAFYSITGEKRP